MEFEPHVIWFLVGLAFLLLEMAMPAFIVFFFALGAFLVSLTLRFFEPGLSFVNQINLFTFSSVFLLLILRKYSKNIFLGRQEGDKISKSQDSKKNIATVSKTIEKGSFGEIKFQGTFYKAKSEKSIKKGVVVEVLNPNDSKSNLYHVKEIKEE